MMNRARRTQVAKAESAIEDAKTALEALQEEEQDAFDALPDRLQNTTQGEAIQSAADELQGAVYALEEALGFLQAAVTPA